MQKFLDFLYFLTFSLYTPSVGIPIGGFFFGSMAQLVEQLAVNQRVAGSNPAVSVLRSLYQAHKEWNIIRR